MTLEQFTTLCAARYSCRGYDPALPVSDDQVKGIVETARLAPSAVNRQPWRIVAVRDTALRQQLLARSRPAFNRAPVLLAVIGNHDAAWHRPHDGKDHTDIDTAIATQHLALAAQAAGLATCWVCSFDNTAAATLLGIQPHEEVVALMPLGYAAEGPGERHPQRKTTHEILEWR